MWLYPIKKTLPFLMRNYVPALRRLNSSFITGERRNIDRFSIFDTNNKQINEIEKSKWKSLVSEIEQFVEYPTAYYISKLTCSPEFTCCFSNDSSKNDNLSMLIQNIIRNLQKSKKSEVFYPMSLFGFLMMKLDAEGNGKDEGVTHRQMLLLEACELIWASVSFYDGDGIFLDRKLTVLLSDYMIAKLHVNLAQLHDDTVIISAYSAMNGIIDLGFIDYVSNFLSFASSLTCSATPVTNSASPANYQATKMWYTYNARKAKLFSTCFKSIFTLSNNIADNIITSAYHFGENLALALQAYIELQQFFSAPNNFTNINVVDICSSSPLMYYTEGSISSNVDKEDIFNHILYQNKHVDLYKKVKEGTAISVTKRLIKYHADLALKELPNFPQCTSRDFLEKVLLLLKNSTQNP